jgi:hypothetical protein
MYATSPNGLHRNLSTVLAAFIVAAPVQIAALKT